MTASRAGLARRPETAADAAFRFDLFCGSRQPHETLAGLEPALADRLMRHQCLGQDASYREAYPAARHDIIEVGGEPVGRIVLDQGREVWTIVDIAIATPWRGRGLGTQVLTDVLTAAHAATVPVRLRVMRTDADARRLYARLGFVRIATTEIDDEMVWSPPS